MASSQPMNQDVKYNLPCKEARGHVTTCQTACSDRCHSLKGLWNLHAFDSG
jgi:hypothetical protein